jgi:hypothetical protein
MKGIKTRPIPRTTHDRSPGPSIRATTAEIIVIVLIHVLFYHLQDRISIGREDGEDGIEDVVEV